MPYLIVKPSVKYLSHWNFLEISGCKVSWNLADVIFTSSKFYPETNQLLEILFHKFYSIILFQPRPNEAGGMFGNGIIVRKYEVNQVIKVRVELTANHMGYFEFRVCPNNALKKPASQMCLDKHILKQQNLNGPR